MRKSGSIGGAAQPDRVRRTGSTGSSVAATSRLSLYGQNSATKRSMTPSGTCPSSKISRSGGRGSYSGATTVLKDPRPVATNKAYKEQCIGDLHNFLIENGYPHPISLKTLNQPSSNDFKKIFEFLMSFHRSNFKLTQKLEEEVPMLLKLYGYPFLISKSHLQTIGVPHTWPTLLSALHWLRVNIGVGMSSDFESVLVAPAEGDPVREKQKKVAFAYINNTYDLYMSGDDLFEHVKIELQKELAPDSEVNAEIEALTKEREQNMAILEELIPKSDELVRLRGDLASAELDIERCELQQPQLLSQLHKLGANFKTISDEDQQLSNRLESLEREKKTKISLVDSQRDAGINFPRMMTKVNNLKRKIAILEKENQDLDKEDEILEKELVQHREQVEDLVMEYNRIRRELNLMQDDLEIKPELTETESIHLQPIRAQLRELSAVFEADLERLDVELSNVKAKVDYWEEIIQDDKKKQDALDQEMAKLDEQIEQKKDAHRKKVKAVQEQEALMKGQNSLEPADVLKKGKQLEDGKRNLELMKTKLQEKEGEMCSFINAIVLAMVEHKQMMKLATAQAAKQVKKCLDDLKGGQTD